MIFGKDRQLLPEKTSHASELDAYSQAVFTFNSLK
jgi:hypothetical protein